MAWAIGVETFVPSLLFVLPCKAGLDPWHWYTLGEGSIMELQLLFAIYVRPHPRKHH